MTSSIETRVRLLEVIVPRGCAVCRDWSELVIVDDDGVAERPERCLACGRLVRIGERHRFIGIGLEVA